MELPVQSRARGGVEKAAYAGGILAAAGWGFMLGPLGAPRVGCDHGFWGWLVGW